MQVNVGTFNEVKINAVRDALAQYGGFSNATVSGVSVESSVSEQPRSLEETLRGARNRARGAFATSSCDYGFGIESGLVEVPHTKTGYMDITSCAIYDGVDLHVGLSSALELPKRVITLALEQNMNLNDACRTAKLTEKENLGNHEGFVGLLTKNRITRKDYTIQAIMMAMVHLENDMS